jgi:uncharacterized protein (UPF0179 family)
MMPITLIDKRSAKEGYLFIHYGAAEECAECKLSKTCLENLEAGRKYRVVGVRKKSHTCAVYGEAVVVEVEEAEVEAGIEPRKALIGAKLVYSPVACNKVLCENYLLCSPEGLKVGDVVMIKDSGAKLSCERGLPLVKVVLRRVPR